uniref:Neural cell adhesion molecule 1-like n=2 Tax=Steinernema glaseri TaxID=37863 RepID=A0A1I7Z383_9BILA
MRSPPLLLLLFILIPLCSVRAFHVHISPPGGKITKKTGDNLMVICQLRDLDDEPDEVTIEWFRDDSPHPISRSGRITASRRHHQSQLLFVKPTVEDGGQYRCVINVDDDKQSSETNVTFVEAVRFVDPQPSQHPEEGTEARIVCHVDGDDSLEIFWQFEGNNIHEESPRGYVFEDRGQVLAIPKYSAASDDGVYVCNAALFSTFESLAINVTGYAPPEITVFNGPSENRALEGHAARLECQATGKPKPTYRWFHERDGKKEELVNSDKYGMNDGLLVVESVGASDAGDYQCVATNSLREDTRSVSISVFQKPRIEKIADVTIQQGHPLEIVCNFHGDEAVNVTWFFDEEPIEALEEEGNSDEADEEEELLVAENEQSLRRKRQSSHKIVERVENSLKLKIGSVAQADAGKYTCVAENLAGKTESSTTLLITHGPYLMSQSHEVIRSFDGNTVTLFCEVSAIPAPTWTWFRNGDEVSANGHTIIIDDQPSASHLSVTTNEDEDYGSYKCSAKNDYGEIESTPMDVQHIFPPSLPISVVCNQFAYPNYGRCSVDGYEDTAASRLPTKFTVYYALDERILEPEFTWEHSSQTTELSFNNSFEIKNLVPSSRYYVRVRATNEAGASELSESVVLETTDPWRPETVTAVDITCGVPCVVSWAPANDHGSKIISYRLTLTEITGDDTEIAPEYAGQPTVLEVNGEDSKIDISGLRSNTVYELNLVAENAKGLSEPRREVFRTSDLTQNVPLSSSKAYALFVACFIIIVVILVIVDITCFCSNRCGLIACFYSNCLGRANAGQKSRDIERANRCESNRLLEDVKPEAVPLRDEKKFGPHSTAV